MSEQESLESLVTDWLKLRDKSHPGNDTTLLLMIGIENKLKSQYNIPEPLTFLLAEEEKRKPFKYRKPWYLRHSNATVFMMALVGIAVYFGIAFLLAKYWSIATFLIYLFTTVGLIIGYTLGYNKWESLGFKKGFNSATVPEGSHHYLKKYLTEKEYSDYKQMKEEELHEKLP